MADYIGAVGCAELARKLAMVPVEARKTLRPRLRAAGQVVRDTAAANASWSTRIPASLSVRVAFGGSRTGVSIVSSAGKAPHARPYEGITGEATFPHPLNFPWQDKWVDQATRPFLRPALLAHRDTVIRAVEDAVDDAIRSAGI